MAADPGTGRGPALDSASALGSDPGNGRDAGRGLGQPVADDDLATADVGMPAEVEFTDRRGSGDPGLLEGRFRFAGELGANAPQPGAAAAAVGDPAATGDGPAFAAFEAFAPDFGIGWETAFGATKDWSFGWAAGVRGPAFDEDGAGVGDPAFNDDPFTTGAVADDEDSDLAPALSFGFVFGF